MLTVISADRDVDDGAGSEVRAGEGDRDRGALHAAGGSDRGEARRAANAAVHLDFTQTDVGAGGIVDGKRTHVIVRPGKECSSAEPSLGSCPTATLLPSLKVSVPASDVVGEIGPVVKRDAGNRNRRGPLQLNPGAGELADSGPLFRVVAGAAVADAVDGLDAELT